MPIRPAILNKSEVGQVQADKKKVLALTRSKGKLIVYAVMNHLGQYILDKTFSLAYETNKSDQIRPRDTSQMV